MALWVLLLSGGPARAAHDVPPKGQMIPLGDFGADEMAYISISATPPTEGIVLVPDAFGLDDFTKSEADRLAGMGYLVVAVDIYNGNQMTDPGYLANMVANLNTETVMKTVNAGIRLLNESPTYHTDHVVAMGWGTGATYVFQEARNNKSLDGAITFYGPVPTPQGQIQKFAVPLCAVYPDRDPVATHDAVEAFLLAASHPGAVGRVFNLGGSRPVSLRELARMLVETNGGGSFRVRAFPAARKKIDIGDYYADYRLITRILGWRPRTDLRTALARTLEYYRTELPFYV